LFCFDFLGGFFGDLLEGLGGVDCFLGREGGKEGGLDQEGFSSFCEWEEMK